MKKNEKMKIKKTIQPFHVSVIINARRMINCTLSDYSRVYSFSQKGSVFQSLAFHDIRNWSVCRNGGRKRKFLEYCRSENGSGRDVKEGTVTCETELLARLESAQAFVPYPRLTCAPPLPPDLTLPELTSLWR